MSIEIAIEIEIGIGIGIEIVCLIARSFRLVVSRSDRSDLETVVDTFPAGPESCHVVSIAIPIAISISISKR
jgi:hypothetical protein